LLEGVRIYDQDGRPVENLDTWDWAECLDRGGWYAGGSQGNVFPRPTIIYRDDDGFGRSVDPVSAAPFGLALPGSAATTDTSEDPATGDGDGPEA
jgi:hypothetical protein